MSITNLPKQKISLKEKLAKPKEGEKPWGEKCIDAIIENSSFERGYKISSALNDYYDIYNGELNKDFYKHILNPYNTTNEKYTKFPAKLRNYNIIKPIIDLLLGEKSKQPFTYQVITTNEDSINIQEEAKHRFILQLLQQEFVNELNSLGADTGVESKESVDIQEAIKHFDTNYKDMRAQMAQQSLEYLEYDLELREELQEAFFHWLVSGYVYSYKDVTYDDVDYEVINPLNISASYAPNVKFIEDGDTVCRREILSVNQVIDKFRLDLTDEQIDNLEDPYAHHEIIEPWQQSSNVTDTIKREIQVYHCVWKSFKKIGIATYLDEMGQPQSQIVDEDYKAMSDEIVDWEWISEVWEGYKIDRDIYVKIRQTQVQRTSLNNISECKLPYNGRVYSNVNSYPVSIISLGIPYQILYNIFHYKLELAVAKSKDKIVLMEINAIPKRHGWDEEKFMYWADAAGFAFIDTTGEGKSGERISGFNQYQVLDASMGEFIGKMFDLLSVIKEEWEDTLGITRQRKGNTLASDAVGNNERAVFQSSVITEELFRRFRSFEQRELQGLIDVAKIAWKDGKKGQYINSEYKKVSLNVDGNAFRESDYDVFVSNSSEDANKLETLRNMALSFAQNGGRPSTIAEILDAKHFLAIKNKLKEVEEIEQQMAAQQQQAEQQAAQQLEQMRIEDREDQQAFASIESEKDRNLQRELKNMDLSNKENIPEDTTIDREKLNIDRDKIRSDEQQKRMDIQSKEKIEMDKLKVAREKIANDLKIAKSRPSSSKK